MILFRVLFSAFKQFLSASEGNLRGLRGSRVFPRDASFSHLTSVFNSYSFLKSSFVAFCLCVQSLSLQAGFSFTPLPLEYDCAYLTLPMELDATTFDCVVGPGCSVTMAIRVSVLDSAQNEFYAVPLTFPHPCDLFPTLTYTHTWPPGWFVYNGLIPGATYWIQLELLSFTANTSATQTYLFGNSLKVQLEPPVAYAQPTILTTQSFVYSPMVADFIWEEVEPIGIQAKTNTIIQLESTSSIYGNVDYRWHLDGKLIGTDSVISYTAPCYAHEIRLEVEQVPGGCVTEKKLIIPSPGGCISPLREGKRPILPGLIERGERMELPEVFGRKYRLMDLSGKELPLDTRQLPQGIYYLRIEQGRETKIHKFIVQ